MCYLYRRTRPCATRCSQSKWMIVADFKLESSCFSLCFFNPSFFVAVVVVVAVFIEAKKRVTALLIGWIRHYLVLFDWLALTGLQSRFDSSKFQVVCPQNGLAVLNLRANVILSDCICETSVVGVRNDSFVRRTMLLRHRGIVQVCELYEHLPCLKSSGPRYPLHMWTVWWSEQACTWSDGKLNSTQGTHHVRWWGSGVWCRAC